MPYNAVIEANFSETQYSSSEVENASVISYIAEGDEFGFTDDRLIDGTPLLVFRAGFQWNIIDIEDTFGSGREVKVDNTTGEVTFNTNLSPFIAGEDATILFTPAEAAEAITEPVTLQHAKDWLKVETGSDDEIITDLISAARLACEKYVNKSLVQRTVTAVVNNGLGGIFLPYSPHGEIVSAVDEFGNDATLTTRGDKNIQVMEPACEYLKIVYTAGFSTCPQVFRTAILRAIAYMYSNRGNEQSASEIGASAEQILSPFRDVV